MTHATLAPRGFAALAYVLTLSTALLTLATTAFAHELALRQHLSREEAVEHARAAARTCIDFALRAYSGDITRVLQPGLIIQVDSETPCTLVSASRTATAADITAQATVAGHSARLQARATRSGSAPYRLTMLRDALSK